MKANQTHISFKTAKLLKDCEIHSKYTYQMQFSLSYYWIIGKNGYGLKDKSLRELGLDIEYPAYTWQEILWEYVDKFFGKKPDYGDGECDNHSALHTHKILNYLQQKKYEEVDLYFRKNNIFTNKA